MRRAGIPSILLLAVTTHVNAQFFDFFQPTRAYNVQSRTTSQRYEYGVLPEERNDGAYEKKNKHRHIDTFHIGDDPFAYLLGVSDREENRGRSRTTKPPKRLNSSQATSKSKNNRNTGNTKDADKNLRNHESIPKKKTGSDINDNDIYKEIKPQKISTKSPGITRLAIRSESPNRNSYDSGNYYANQGRYDHTKPSNIPEYQSSFGYEPVNEKPSYANRRPDISDRPNLYTPDLSYSTEYPVFSNKRPDYNDEPYYNRPDTTFNRPDNTHNRPDNNNKRPDGTNNRPDNTYNRPDYSNNRPDTTYNQPDNTYNRPDNAYNRPDNTYNRPDNTNNRPDNTYNRPDNTNNRPDNTYNRPDNTYNPPNIRRPIQHPSISQHTTTGRPYSGVKPVVAVGPPITNKPVTAAVPYTEQPIVTRGRPDDMVKFPGPDDGTPDLVRGPDVTRLPDDQVQALEDYMDSLCAEYARGDTEAGAAIPLLPAPAPVRFNVSRCPPRGAPLIVGGSAVRVEHFPHAAELGWPNIERGGYSWKCGGSLISDQFVLTAAHCAYQERDNTVVSGPPRVVQLGSSFLDDPGALVVHVAKVIRHPSYRIPQAYHDLALLKLQSAVQFSEVIRPACVGAPPPPGDSVIAIGWGQTAYSGNTSRELRGVSLPVWQLADCARALGTSRKLPRGPDPRSQLCAGDPRGDRDTCQGDSGGGALVRSGCRWAVVGVTSLGRACGAPRTPALYATPARAFIAAVIQRA